MLSPIITTDLAFSFCLCSFCTFFWFKGLSLIFGCSSPAFSVVCVVPFSKSDEVLLLFAEEIIFSVADFLLWLDGVALC